jgi:predicted Zn-ribbon and HTH transcriptional regulator
MKEEKCKHKNKAYSSVGMTLTVNPPINISYWVCKDCGFEGQDSERAIDLDKEYREIKQRFRKGGSITLSNQ